LCWHQQELRVILSVVIITHNEEANIGRTLASLHPLVADGKGEIIVVDSGSTDRHGFEDRRYNKGRFT
jgi:glycosyltransferase involved in cell wall biosynthesis